MGERVQRKKAVTAWKKMCYDKETTFAEANSDNPLEGGNPSDNNISESTNAADKSHWDHKKDNAVTFLTNSLTSFLTVPKRIWCLMV